MEQVKQTDTHTYFKKKSGRHAVQQNKSKTWINGDDKAALLLAEGLIEPPKAKAPAPAEPEGGDAEGAAAEDAPA